MTARPEVELAHLAFHTPGRLASSARDDAVFGEFGQERVMEGRSRLRGE